LLDEVNKVLGNIESENLSKDFTIELSEEFTYLRYCFYESLRIDSPVPITSSITFTQDTKCGNSIIKKGDIVLIYLSHLHTDPREW